MPIVKTYVAIDLTKNELIDLFANIKMFLVGKIKKFSAKIKLYSPHINIIYKF